MSSGTSVPSPRTSRSIGPRFASSVQTVALSTVGAAGRNLESPTVTPPRRSTAAAPNPILRIILARAFDGRGISISCSSFWHTLCRELQHPNIFYLQYVSQNSGAGPLLCNHRYRDFPCHYRTVLDSHYQSPHAKAALL